MKVALELWGLSENAMTRQPVKSEAASIKKLHEFAVRARKKAYAPYSKFKVGVALETRNGKIFTGCNIENAAYGPTICAERVAISKAVSEGELKFRRIMIVTDTKKTTPPCGVCRQVMAEFGMEIEIVLANLKGDKKIFRLQELLPNAFLPKSLQKDH